jgi:hypothetical protein
VARSDLDGTIAGQITNDPALHLDMGQRACRRRDVFVHHKRRTPPLGQKRSGWSIGNVIWWIVTFGTLGGAGATAGSALVMAFPERMRRAVLPWLLSYATGTLLGAAFLGMMPKAFAQAPAFDVSATVLAGLVAFFALEKLVIWRHCHERECEVHGSAGPLILIGDAFHNFVDGIVIAAAFLVSIP